MSDTPITLTAQDQAPSWSAEALTPNGPAQLSSEQLKGQAYVIYFYSKDDTPGCTAEACSLRDNYQDLISQGYAPNRMVPPFFLILTWDGIK